MAQMPESEKKILEEVEYLRDKYFTYDEPVPFCGLYLYPVSVRNYNEFMTSNTCLLLNKNDDPMGISLPIWTIFCQKFQTKKRAFCGLCGFLKLLSFVFIFCPG